MAINYTAYPTTTDLTALLASANITLGAGVSADMKQLALDSAVGELEYATGRQFAPGSMGEVRYFDGSGTGMMEIDDYIALTMIEFFQVPATSTVSINNWVEVQHLPFNKTRIQILQGPANMSVGWWQYFPQGRSNIKITGQFGFPAVPAKVWRAVVALASANMADQARVTPNGILTGLKDLDQDFTWSEKQISMMAGWRHEFDSALKLYKRPLRAYLNRATQVLV